MHKWYYSLASKKLTIVLWIVLCLFLIITTFTEQNDAFGNILRILLAMMVVNLSLCTLQRIKTFSKPVLMIHIGVIITFISGAISTYGFVATVNIYEGSTVDKVYRWDLEEDVSLGADLTVEKLHEEYYPVPVKIGVLSGGKKQGLFIRRTGESFELGKYRINVEKLDISEEKLELGVYNNGDYIGHADTSGNSALPPGFPFEFRLVAYMDPIIKKSRVDLKLSRGREMLAEGSTAVNSPMIWQGMRIYHTATNRDNYGNTFVGLQITRDPGVYYVYTGFCITAAGGIFYLIRRINGLG